MEQQEIVESPRKRQKTDAVAAIDGAEVSPQSNAAGQDAQAMKELDVGILELVTPDSEGFFGTLKKR